MLALADPPVNAQWFAGRELLKFAQIWREDINANFQILEM